MYTPRPRAMFSLAGVGRLLACLVFSFSVSSYALPFFVTCAEEKDWCNSLSGIEYEVLHLMLV